MSAALAAYLPTDARIVALAALGLLGVVAAGAAIGRLRSLAAARLAAWLVVLGAGIGIERLCAAQPPGFRMLAIIGVTLWALKATVLTETRAAGGRLPQGWRWLGFVVGWPGMQPKPFAAPPRGVRADAGDLAGRGLRRLIAGLALLGVARLIWLTTNSAPLATLPLLPGLSLILHFGLFNLVAGGWRRAGVGVGALFRAPLLSQSLTEFWGRRWNLAFSELTALAVYRPLVARLGQTPALLASFACSGLLHELAISVPVRAGFGLPLLYFALHGGLMLIEREFARRGRPLGGRIGRAWTFAWIALPLPLLFHEPFLRGIVWPLIGIGG